MSSQPPVPALPPPPPVVGPPPQTSDLERGLLDCNRCRRICTSLPMRDREYLVGYLQKVSDTLVSGVLSVNVFCATYYLWWQKIPTKDHPANNELHLCFEKSLAWKAFFIGLPFLLYPFTLWVSGLAKAAESGYRGLKSVSFCVFLEIFWCLAVGSFMTNCLSGASFRWIAGVAAGVFVLLVVMWTFTFHCQKFLRCCCCCNCCIGADPIEARNDDLIAEWVSAQVSRARDTFLTKIKSEKEAEIALKAKTEADVKFAAAKKKVEDAEKTVSNSQEEVSAKTIALQAAVDTKQELEVAVAVAAAREIAAKMAAGQGSSSSPVGYLDAAGAVFVAKEELQKANQDCELCSRQLHEANTICESSQKALEDANTECAEAEARAKNAELEADTKAQEVTEARNRAKDAFDAAKAAREEAAVA